MKETIKKETEKKVYAAVYLRPSFQEMIKDMEAGKVNLIIVKDLSRFGREYIEAGRYLQKIFPVAGENVKLIFQWKLDGMSNGRIAEKLNALGIPAPADYKRSLGIRYQSVL